MSNTDRSIPVSEGSEDSHEEPKAGVSGAYDALNNEQQKFVMNMLRGDTPPNAYRHAGYSSKKPWSEAWALRRHPYVRAALDELGYVAGVAKAEIIEQLRSMLDGCDLADFEPWIRGEKSLAELRDEGVPTHVLSRLHIYVGGDGRSLQREDRLATLKMLSELLGYNAPTKSEVAMRGSVEIGGGLTHGDLDELCEQVAERVAAGRSGGHDPVPAGDVPRGAEQPDRAGLVAGGVP